MTEKKRSPVETRKKLLNAVGTVLANKGFKELKVKTISDISGVDKKLIYHHFGDLKGLISAFLESNDFWINSLKDLENLDKEAAQNIFIGQYETLKKSKLLKQLLAWELGEKHALLKAISDERESIGVRMIDQYKALQEPEEDVNPIFAILVAGIYYLTMHSEATSSTFCGLNLKDKADSDRLEAGIKRIIDKCI